MKHSSDSSNAASKQNESKSSLHKHNNEEAQAAIVFLFIVGLVAILSLYIFISPVMDSFSSFHYNATQGTPGHPATLALSQERQDSIYLLQIAFQDYPLIVFILMILAAIVAALRWRTGNA